MSGVLASRGPFALCSCGHAWMAHDIAEYDGDGSDTCCVEAWRDANDFARSPEWWQAFEVALGIIKGGY